MLAASIITEIFALVWGLKARLKRRNNSTRLNGATTQKTAILILTHNSENYLSRGNME
jgi:hypothetical protein